MVGENLKKLRESLGLTQMKFAARIGLTQGTLSAVESNKSAMSRQSLMSISREFGVRLEWLETGEGEMYKQADTSILAQLESTGLLTPKGRELMEIYLRMPPSTQDLIADAISAAAKFYPRKVEQSPVKPDNEKTREEMHDQLDAELDAKEAAEKREISTSLASTGTNGSSKKFGNSS